MNETAMWIMASSTLATAIAFVVLVIVVLSVFFLIRKASKSALHVSEAIHKRVCPTCTSAKCPCHCPTCTCTQVRKKGKVEEEEEERESTPAADLVELLVLGASLFKKFRDKRR